MIMLRYFSFLAIFSLLLVAQLAAQSRQSNRQQPNDAHDKYRGERNAASDNFWRERNVAANKYREERNVAADRFWKERNAAIQRYQKAFEVSLGRAYSFEKDTSITKALVESALRDSIEPKNLINAVKVLESGVENGVNVDDALDVAHLVQLENTNVSAEQTVAFSQARQIAKERNLDAGQTDEMLYNALRQETPADSLVEIAKSLRVETTPPQSQNTFSKASWESIMRNKIQEFFTAKTPYRWGGNSIRDGVDCSGFTTIVLNEIGIENIRKYRQSVAQFRKYENNNVEPRNAKFGDLIFFYNHKEKGKIDHVGIVEKVNDNGEVVFVHSSRRRKGIGRDIMTDPSYWKMNFAGIKRVV
jgi:cell wall-associated NlpC family hydrolase